MRNIPLLFLCLVLVFFVVYPGFTQTVHHVEAGTDQIVPVVQAAAEGDIIELVTDGGVYLETSSIEIDKSLTIRALDGLETMPVIQNDDIGESNGVFKMVAGGNLTLMDIEFTNAKHLIRVDNDSSNAVLKVMGCFGHTSNESLIRVYGGAWLDSLIVRDTFFRDCAKEGIYLKEPNTFGYAEFENCTFVHTGREAIRVRDNDDAMMLINHCTFDSITYDKDYRAVYPENVQNVIFKNSMITNKLGTHSEAIKLFGSSTIHHSNLFNSGDVQANDAATIGDGMLSVDPLYTDPSIDDYTLELSSPVLGMADDGQAMGDLRWDPTIDMPNVIQVQAGTDQIAAAYAAAEDGDIIELVTSGGLYFETGSIVLDKSIIVRAMDGLTQMPMIQNDDYGESNGVFKLEGGANLTLMGVEFFNAKHLIRVDNGGTNAVLKVIGCYGHTAKETLIKVYPGSMVDSLIVNDTIFRDSEKEGIYLKEPNTFAYAEFVNCTIIHTGREAIRVRDNDTATMLINHCTFDSITYDKDYRAIYPENVQNVEIKNTIISNKLGTHSEAVKLFGNSSIHHVDIWNSGKIQLNDAATASDTLFVDPLYFDPANDDYRLALDSPVRGAADDGRAMGDLRWEVSPDQVRLSIITEGMGSVELSPAGEWFDVGAQVTVTATPDFNWKVAGWEGVLVFPPDAPTATITMDADKEVKIIFEPLLERYTIDLTTIGVGHVEFTPASLDTADYVYYEGTEVTMTAVSDTTSMEFENWTGDIESTDNPLTLTVDGDKAITATFTPVVPQSKIEVEIVGKGDVMMVPEPYAVYDSYDTGTVVSLIAEPVPGFQFDGWSGDVVDADANDTLTVTLAEDLSIIATFTEIELAGGVLEIDTTWALEDAVEFVRNNTQVDTIVLTTDGGTWPAHDFITVDMDLAIVAKEGLSTKPKIEGNPDLNYSSGIFQIKRSVSSLTLRGLEVYGAKYQVRTDDDTLTTKIRIDDCYFHDAGEVWVKVYILGMVDSLIITNSMFRECQKEGIYLKEPNTVGFVKLENSTFIRSGREVLRMRDNPDAVLEINHCTFDSTDWESDYRVLYPEDTQNATIKNCIITNQLFTKERHADFLRIYGNSHASNIVTYNASDQVDPEEDATVDTTTIWSFDPLYEAPENRNYTLLPASHAYGLADDGEAAGDLNWATHEPTHLALSVVVEGGGTVMMNPGPVGETYDPDTEVTLTAVADSGYTFAGWSGAVSSTESSVTLTVDSDKSVTAVFTMETGVENLANVPHEYALNQNYPNPFNPSTTISFSLKKEGKTTLRIYDTLGRQVETLVDRNMKAGRYDVVFHIPKLATGVYFYKLVSGDFVSIKKMILVK